jgi:hypothetical protein
VSTRSLDEIKQDLNNVDGIEGEFERFHLFLGLCSRNIGLGFLVPILILVRENEDEWSNEQVIHNDEGDNEVPDLARSSLFVYEIPLKLALVRFDLLHFFVCVLVDVVDHHFLQVRLGHFLQASLETQFVRVTPCFPPQVVHPLLFLLLT